MIAVVVDGRFHGATEPWVALHLVERHRFRAPDQDVRIAAGGVEHVEFVQGPVAPAAPREVLGERALAGLPRAGHDHRRHDPEPLAQGAAHQPGKGLHGMDDNDSLYEWNPGATAAGADPPLERRVARDRSFAWGLWPLAGLLGLAGILAARALKAA